MAFFYFQYDFTSSRSTADLLKVVSDRITRALGKSQYFISINKSMGILFSILHVFCHMSQTIFVYSEFLRVSYIQRW